MKSLARLAVLSSIVAGVLPAIAQIATHPAAHSKTSDGAGVESSLVVKGQGYFPVALRLQDGRVAAVLRGGASHLGLGGRLDMVYSSDEGLTWTPPTVVADGPLDDRNPAFGQAANGALVIAFWENSLYDDQGNYTPNLTNHPTRTLVTCSQDGGRTWTKPNPIDLSGLTLGSPYGRMLTLPDGAMLMNIYGAAPGQPYDGSYLFRSTDNGLTWHRYSNISTNGFNETALLNLPSGTLLAALRHEGRSGKGGENVWIARSTDGGLHWSAPQSLTPDRVHPADLLLLPDGRALLVAGDRRGPFGIIGILSNMAGHFSWDNHRVLISNLANSDCGYPSSVCLKNSDLLSLYYSVGSKLHPEWSIHCAALRYNISALRKIGD